jgi:hypothetical protein
MVRVDNELRIEKTKRGDKGLRIEKTKRGDKELRTGKTILNYSSVFCCLLGSLVQVVLRRYSYRTGTYGSLPPTYSEYVRHRNRSEQKKTSHCSDTDRHTAVTSSEHLNTNGYLQLQSSPAKQSVLIIY